MGTLVGHLARANPHRDHVAGGPANALGTDAPEDFIAQQMKAVVPIEFTITRLEGKWKMSQNRSAADIDGVIHGLGASKSAGDHAVAAIVAERRAEIK